ncbi:MAG TPA: cytochrome c-type biogenesis protein [Nevskiaceae bacterium]|nr:cytochrome c-type biogenesis protein [Nevskiaceae bacterium]
MSRRWLAGLLLGVALPLASQPPAAEVEAQLEAIVLEAPAEARYRAFLYELRCLVCQNQTLADSRAPLALDLRLQVRRRIAAGESDEQIRAYLTERYGEFVLYKPRLNARTVLLWAGPALLVVLALVIALRQLRRRPPQPVAAVDAEALRRLLDERPPAP